MTRENSILEGLKRSLYKGWKTYNTQKELLSSEHYTGTVAGQIFAKFVKEDFPLPFRMIHILKGNFLFKMKTSDEYQNGQELL